MELKAWIMSVVGAAVLTLLSDVLLPEGETNGYVKNAISIFIVFLIAFPIPSIVNGEIDLGLSRVTVEVSENYTDETLLYELNQRHVDTMEKHLCEALSKKGITAEVTIRATTENGFFIIEGVDVSIASSVITEQNENIMITTIIQTAMSVTGVKEEAVYIERR